MVNQELDNILTLRIQVTQDIRNLAQHYLLPQKPADPKEAGSELFVKKMALATGAVELVCSLMNVFGTMAGLRNYSGESAIADLTFGMNTNIFWITHDTRLMPIVSAAINAFQDNQQLRQQNQPLWAPLEYHNKNVWLEILPAIMLCLNGYPAMRKVSLEMKQAFEKFLKV